MGSLSNLYISQSYTSLLHLGNDGPVTDLAPGEYTQFQDGLGNSLGISVNANGDISSSGNIYATNIFPTISTASFNQYTASTNVRLNNIESTTASLNNSVTQLNASSASQQVSINNLNTFTASLSTASVVASITNLNQFTASANIRLNNLESTSASVNISISNLNSTTASQGVSITNLNASSASQQVSINALNVFTASQSTASLVTSISNLNQFTQSQQSFNSSATASISQLLSFSSSLDNNFVTEAELAAATASLISQINTKLNTASFNQYTQSNDQRVTSLETNSASVNTSVSNLNQFTSSQLNINAGYNTFTASTNVSLNNLNQFSASTLTSIANLNSATESLQGQLTTIGGQSGSWITESETGSFTTTSSFNAYTASNDQRVNSLEVNSASVNVSITNLNSTTQSLQGQLATIGGQSGSWVTESETGSFARVNATNTFTENQIINADLTVSGTINAYKLNVTIESSSVIYSSGSNQFGDDAVDVQTLYGSVRVVNELTASGLNYPTTDNGVKSFMQTDGAGNLSLQYVKTVYETVRNTNSYPIVKGAPLFASGSTGDNANVFYADAADSTIMPAVYIAGEDLAPGATGLAIVGGLIEGVNTTGFPAGTIVYVAEGGGWSASRPSGSSSVVQVLGVVQKEGVGGQGVVINQLEAVLPNIQTGYTWVGNGLNQPVQVATSSLQTNTGSLVTTASFNAYTSSNDQRVSSLEINSASVNISISNLNTFTASQSTASLVTSIDNLNQFSASALVSLDNLNQATSSLFTSASLALTTASISGQTLTFSKGDGTTFDILIPDVSGSTIDTGSFATTGSNTFNGDQNISGSIFFPNGAEIRGNAGQQTLISSQTALTISSSVNSTYSAESLEITSSNQTIIGSNGYVELDAPRVDTKGVATISNMPNLSQGEVYLLGRSGSLILGNSTDTPTYAALSHLSSSDANANTNLIFKSNNNTADTIISGSDNIMPNFNAPTAGFKRYIGTRNIVQTLAGPQISGSMTFSPAINGNYIAGNGYTIRGPISASSYNISNNVSLGSFLIGSSVTLNAEKLTNSLGITQNMVAGFLNVIGNQSEIRTGTTIAQNNINGVVNLNLSSSAVNFLQNTINDNSFTFTNQFSSGSLGVGLPTVTMNTMSGFGNLLIVTGSQAVLASNNQAGFNQNAFMGYLNTAFVNSSEARVNGATIYHQLIATNLLGHRLVVTGSSNVNDTTSFGSTFVGRFNAADGVRDKSSDIIFAVGTGTSTSNRKTGFLIDSGSNTFVEGRFNVSGSTSLNGQLIITGSLTASLQEGYVWVGDASGITTAVATSSFGGALPSGLLSSSVTNFDDYSASVDSRINSIVVGTGFATTGSNSFNGNQIITGSMTSSLDIRVAGVKMGFGNPAGTSSIAIGTSTLLLNTGTTNIAIGEGSLRDNTTGNNNIAIGLDTLQFNTTAAQNIAIGHGAFRDSTTGQQNTVIGHNAALNAGNVNNNTIIGRSAAVSIKNGNNTIVGHTAGGSITSGSNNTIVGQAAGNLVGSGSLNTFIGQNSGRNISGSANTLVGTARGVGDWSNVIAISDGQDNIKFFNSGSQTTLTNNTLVSGSLTTTGSVSIGTTMQLTPLDPLPAGTIGMLAVSSSNELYFYNGAWTLVV